MSNVAGTSSSDSPASVSLQAPPRKVGVFWDIQNCNVNSKIQATNVVQNVRELYTELGAVEAEFAVVCDSSQLAEPVIDMLNDLQADVFQVSSHAKNACDEKIKLLMNRFVTVNSENSVVVLISSDINFAPICSDLKYRQNIHVILVHRKLVNPALTAAANECRDYDVFRFGNKLDLDDKKSSDTTDETVVIVSNWPADYSPSQIQKELGRYTDSTGGRVIHISSYGSGIVYFRSLTDAQRFVQNTHNKRVRYMTLTAKIPHYCEPEVDKKTEEKEVQTEQFKNELIQIIGDKAGGDVDETEETKEEEEGEGCSLSNEKLIQLKNVILQQLKAKPCKLNYCNFRYVHSLALEHFSSEIVDNIFEDLSF